MTEGNNEAAMEAGVTEAKKMELKSRFDAVIGKNPDALRGYPEAEFNGHTRKVNEQGAENGLGKVGDEWIEFVYYEPKSGGESPEPWYGVLNEETGEVISTGSELQHWFE